MIQCKLSFLHSEILKLSTETKFGNVVNSTSHFVQSINLLKLQEWHEERSVQRRPRLQQKKWPLTGGRAEQSNGYSSIRNLSTGKLRGWQMNWRIWVRRYDQFLLLLFCLRSDVTNYSLTRIISQYCTRVTLKHAICITGLSDYFSLYSLP